LSEIATVHHRCALEALTTCEPKKRNERKQTGKAFPLLPFFSV
jgi:hypothetical protein